MSHSTIEAAIESIKDKIGAGDQDAFRQLFNCYCKKLTLFALSIVKSQDAAREVVDEVFIRIWRNRASTSDIQNLKVYLYTATKNTALNYLSSHAKRSLTDSFDFFSAEIMDPESPELKMIHGEMLQLIRQAIEALPPRCKMVFKLVREDGLSYREVGQVLNISSKTVDAQMVIAVRQISEQVKKHFDSFPQKKSRNS